jgi:hypothetical protein
MPTGMTFSERRIKSVISFLKHCNKGINQAFNIVFTRNSLIPCAWQQLFIQNTDAPDTGDGLPHVIFYTVVYFF